MLHEARPTLGGAVQTLPEREGDPPPPPDNGQHIALGCFTEYLRFLDRIGKAGALRREPLALPVIDEHGTRGDDRRPGFGSSATRTCPLASRVRIARAALRLRGLTPAADADRDVRGRCSRGSAAPEEIDRFWDVFVRPALNLPDRGGGRRLRGLHRPDGAPRRRAARATCCSRPSRSARCTATRRARARAAGADVRLESRVESARRARRGRGDRRGPAAEAARLLGEAPPALEPSPIVSVHLLFDRPLLRHRLAALLDSPAHWVFDRGALTGHEPPGGGQYLTVVSSGVPDLLEIRGKGLVDLMADALRERLGAGRARLVARQPRAARDVRRPARDA